MINHLVYRRSGRGWEARRVCAVEGDVSSPAASQYSPAASQSSQAASRQFARGGRRVRCFNCGDVTRHMAADCPRPRLPKRCHYCKVMLYKLAEVAIPNLSDYLRDNSHALKKKKIKFSSYIRKGCKVIFEEAPF
jgi:hypothetical protein